MTRGRVRTANPSRDVIGSRDVISDVIIQFCVAAFIYAANSKFPRQRGTHARRTKRQSRYIHPSRRLGK